MKQKTRNALLLALSLFGTVNCLPALAAGNSKSNYVPPNNAPRVSDRLIVKLRPNFLSKGLSVAQINTEMNRPFAAQTISQMQAAAGASLAEIRALSNGAHVLSIPGTPNRQVIDRAIAGIGRLADVEYVEEDKIMTAQVAPPVNDTYYLTGIPVTNPGLWGMWPASAVASPAPGGTGSYGADFETAWAIPATGTNVVVAVVDSGITPHVDIVGPPSNLASLGYNFISDCRIRGSTALGGCPATTPTASATVAPSPDATDTGDFISTADSTTPGSYFYGQPVSNSSWHGTHVAGTIAAIGNNPIPTGVIGGAYNAKILPVRVLGKGGGYLSDIADGIRWAAGVHPTIANPLATTAKVINLSLGGTGPCSVTEQAAINAAVAAGAVVVVASGNDGLDVANASPANCNNVISVAAIARDGSRAAYSNFSSPAYNTTNPAYVTLAAPGGDQGSYPASFDPGILSTINAASQVPDTTVMGTSGPNSYAYYQGTSMATPHVAAAVALMLSKNNTLTPAQVKNILSTPDSMTAFPTFSATSVYVPAAWDCAASRNCGAGILNASKAVQNSITPLTASLTTVDFGTLATYGIVSKTVTLTNNTAGALTVGTAAISGANAAFFTIASNNCTPSIAAAANCLITMNYTPTSAGSHSATLSVPTTAPGAIGIGLTGIRGPVPLTTATPAVTATTVYVGHSTTVNLSFTNPNAIQVALGTVTLSKPAIMALSLDTCSNATLAAGATCNVTVTITPNAVGAYSGTVTASLASSGSSTQATISGSANPVPSGGGGGGGCSVMPAGANLDYSLPLALLAVLAYWLRRRVISTRDAA